MNWLLFKNLLVEIRRTGTRFLSIFAICALGAAFFSGLRATGPDMQESCDALFKEYNLSDITVMSSVGLTQENIEDLREIPGVEAVAPGIYVDAMLTYEEEEYNVRLYSMPIKEQASKTGSLLSMLSSYEIDPDPEYETNTLMIVEGRLPLDETEVVLDSLLMESSSIKVGDYISFYNNAGSIQLRVVGFVFSPKYVGIFERGKSTIGNGSSDAFAYASGNALGRLSSKTPLLNLLGTTYIQADIVIENSSTYSAFSKEYQDLVNTVIDCIKAYGAEQNGTWYVEDRTANPGYSDYKSNTERIAAVADVFPLLFFVVAALVSLTTMTRMVEEQRIEMGTLKALGYGRGAIMGKYFYYAMFACVTGSLLGCVIGFWLFPTVILSAYGTMYRIPNIATPFRSDIALGCTLASMACISLATVAASVAALREVPATLMRPKAPKPGKRVLLEYVGFIWKRLKFNSKVTLRNLFRYKKRFFMCLIGIAGSCSLLVTGLGINDSIFGITERQFSHVWNMDLWAYAYDSMDGEEILDLATNNEAAQYYESYAYCMNSACDAEVKDTRISSVYIMGVESAELLEGKINFLSNGVPCTLTDEGAIITYKLAEVLGLSPGDSLTILHDGTSYTVYITAVVENYVRHYVYMTKTYYQQVFGEEMEYNSFLINLRDGVDDAQVETIIRTLLQDSRMYTVVTLESFMEDMNNVLGVLNYIVLVLVVGSALLTLVVMMNLTNINIEERKRELATLRVLGFLDREMYDYMFRENNLLALIGAAAGLVLGKFVHSFVIKTCEVDLVMFVRTADPMSFVYAFALTIVFSLFVNLLMRRKVRSVNMVESLKSAE